VVVDGVVAQNAIQFGAQALNGASALLVEKMGSKFDGNALEVLKSMCQQKSFALSVKAGPLHIGSVPCGAYFQSLVGRVNVHVSGHAHRLTLGHDREGQHAALLMQFQAPGYFFAHFLG
jgi:hypothetical protein